jgi:hypothetical protein
MDATFFLGDKLPREEFWPGPALPVPQSTPSCLNDCHLDWDVFMEALVATFCQRLLAIALSGLLDAYLERLASSDLSSLLPRCSPQNVHDRPRLGVPAVLSRHSSSIR